MDNTLELFKKKFIEIEQMGWIPSHRAGNDGGVGNTLEDLLDIAENNNQLPDMGEWEIKSHRTASNSLLTLFHTEPEPRDAKIVTSILLPKFGWKHRKASIKYPDSERSFRATLHFTEYSDRGLKVSLDYKARQLYIDFDYTKISDRHSAWKEILERETGLNNFDTRPYWSFDTIQRILDTKITNLLYVNVDRKNIDGVEYFKYKNFEAYMQPTLERFLRLVEEGSIYVDFDARTGHNHGTKIRIRPSRKIDLYDIHIET